MAEAPEATPTSISQVQFPLRKWLTWPGMTWTNEDAPTEGADKVFARLPQERTSPASVEFHLGTLESHEYPEYQQNLLMNLIDCRGVMIPSLESLELSLSPGKGSRIELTHEPTLPSSAGCNIGQLCGVPYTNVTTNAGNGHEHRKPPTSKEASSQVIRNNFERTKNSNAKIERKSNAIISNAPK